MPLNEHSFILASGSPQRKKILSQAGYCFTVIPSHVGEDVPGVRPAVIAERIAEKKARSVAERYPDSWVVGVDTLVALKDGTVLGKPKGQKEARDMIQAFSGSYCDVYSGIALIHHAQRKKSVACEKTRLFFHTISSRELADYLKTNEWKDRSGAMTLEGEGGRFVKKIVGEYWNVIGFPLMTFRKFHPLLQPNS